MRRKTRWVYICSDSAKYNEIKAANGDKANIPGAMTYTTIIDNHGKKFPFIRGFKHQGPIYHNRAFWNRYETDEKTDIMSQFTKVEIKRKVVTVDLNGDGKIDENERDLPVDTLKVLNKITDLSTNEPIPAREILMSLHMKKAVFDAHIKILKQRKLIDERRDSGSSLYNVTCLV